MQPRMRGVDAPGLDRREVLMGDAEQLRPAGDTGPTNSTNRGHGWDVTCTCGAAAKASG